MRRDCPICGVGDVLSLAHQLFEDLPGRSLVGGYDVVCCRACGFAFASGLPGPEDFARYYSEMSKYEHQATGGATSPEDQARCEAVADLVDSYMPDRGVPVLDVGCSTGVLLAAFKRCGYTDVEGLDPSPACADLALTAHNIVVRTGVAADLADAPRRYGLVLLSAVLEHFLDPVQVLRDAHAVLVDGGLLYVEVPDVEGFAECARAPFQEFSVEHINFFSRVSLTSMAGVAGFSCVHSERLRTPWTSGAQAPVIRAVYRKVGSVSEPVSDDLTQGALLEYVAVSERIEDGVRARIVELASRGRPVLVWGVGTHTRHLLAAGTMDGLSVAAYVDSDPKCQGTEMRGVPVLGPEQVSDRREAILISSGTAHREIARQLRDQLGLDNEIILLYD